MQANDTFHVNAALSRISVSSGVVSASLACALSVSISALAFVLQDVKSGELLCDEKNQGCQKPQGP